MKHPPFLADMPVFDTTPSGRAVIAEHQGEHGEMDLEGFGAFDPLADLVGDWSWKPHRYKPDPGRVLTREEIDVLVAAGMLCECRVAEERRVIPCDDIDPETGKPIRNLHFSLFCTEAKRERCKELGTGKVAT